MNEKDPEPIRETVEEFNKRLDLEIKIENKLIAEFIDKINRWTINFPSGYWTTIRKEYEAKGQ